jgi:hypothetical protein
VLRSLQLLRLSQLLCGAPPTRLLAGPLVGESPAVGALGDDTLTACAGDAAERDTGESGAAAKHTQQTVT